jgi:uncharacterized protein (TIGR02594 family)
MARDFLKYGKKTDTPVVGDIVVLWRDKKEGPFGHVGIFIKSGVSNIYILGGNQSERVSIEVYPKTQLLGFRTLRQE